MPILEARNLSLSIGSSQILSQINLTLEKGRCLGIIGTNGSGKTSLLSLLAGLIRPTKGEVIFGGQNLTNYTRRHIAQKIAFVEQQADTTDLIDARQAVDIGRTPYKSFFSPWTDEDENAVISAIEKVDMVGFEKRRWSSLSGGEKQRLHIARALAQDPDILILDEPTNHLDIGHQLDLLSLINSLELSVIVSLHDLNHAAMFCHQLILLNHGKLYASGAAQEVLTESSIRDVFGANAKIERYSDGDFSIRFIKP